MLTKSQIIRLIDQYVQLINDAKATKDCDLSSVLSELNQSDWKEFELACLESLDKYQLPESLLIARLLLDVRGGSSNLNKAFDAFSAAINSGNNEIVVAAVSLIKNLRQEHDELVQIIESSFNQQPLEIKLALSTVLLSRSSPEAIEAIKLAGSLMSNPEVEPLIRMLYAVSFINTGLRTDEAWRIIEFCLESTTERSDHLDLLIDSLHPSVHIPQSISNSLLTLLPQLEEGNVLRTKLQILLGRSNDPAVSISTIKALTLNYGMDFSAAFSSLALEGDSEFCRKYLPMLIDRLERENTEGRMLIASHLAQLGRLTLRIEDAVRLVECLNNERDILVIEHLVYVLMRCNESIVEPLLSILKDSSHIRMIMFTLPLIRVGDATRRKILDYIANNPHDNLTQVIKLIFLEHSLECSEELGAYGELLTSADERVAHNMLYCLQRIGPPGKPLIPYLIPLIVGEDGWRKDMAVNVLVSIGLEVLPYLNELVNNYGELPVFNFVRSRIELSSNESETLNLGFIKQRQFLVTYVEIGNAFDTLGKVGLRKVSDFIKAKTSDEKSYSPANLKKTLHALNTILSERWNREVHLVKVEHGTTILTTEGLRFLSLARKYLSSFNGH